MIKNETILNTNTELLLVPTTKNYACIGILFCNFSEDDETVTIFAVKSGESIVDKATIIKDFKISAKNTLNFEFKLLLAEGDKVVAIGSNGSKVAATLSYTAFKG